MRALKELVHRYDTEKVSARDVALQLSTFLVVDPNLVLQVTENRLDLLREILKVARQWRLEGKTRQVLPN